MMAATFCLAGLLIIFASGAYNFWLSGGVGRVEAGVEFLSKAAFDIGCGFFFLGLFLTGLVV